MTRDIIIAVASVAILTAFVIGVIYILLTVFWLLLRDEP